MALTSHTILQPDLLVERVRPFELRSPIQTTTSRTSYFPSPSSLPASASDFLVHIANPSTSFDLTSFDFFISSSDRFRHVSVLDIFFGKTLFT